MTKNTTMLVGLLATAIGLSSGCCGLRNCNSNCGPFANLGGRLACSGGCGEVYVGEYTNHPPVVDPCGSCDGCACGADFNGGSCQPRRPILEGLATLWGVPYSPTNCGNCGVATCRSCQGGCSSCGRGTGPAFMGSEGGSSCNCGGSENSSSMSYPSGTSTEVHGGSLQPIPDAQARTSPNRTQRIVTRPSSSVQPAQFDEARRSTSTSRKLAPSTQRASSTRLVTVSEDEAE